MDVAGQIYRSIRRRYRPTVRNADRFTYNRRGEVASATVADESSAYAYDALSRLVAAYSNGTLVVSNRYDHLGRRVQKIAPDGTHTFLYDGWRPVVDDVTVCTVPPPLSAAGVVTANRPASP